MKLNKIYLTLAAGLAFTACSDIDEIVPQSDRMLESQVKETNTIVPSRAEASFTGMFTSIGKPYAANYETPDDFAFLVMAFCNDLEGADALMPDSGYNWFSVCGEYSSRNANYRNPYIRYRTPYKLIADVNTFVSGFPEDVSDENSIRLIAQARALRAFAYMQLVPAFQFVTNLDGPAVPLVTPETEDFTHNPRAAVRDIYTLVIEDLNYAVEKLEGFKRSSKMYIDQTVAYGLRARANLDLGNYDDAAADAARVIAQYTPASIAEVSKPSFMSIDEHNWVWGYDMTAALTLKKTDATPSSWLRSFSGDSYSAACQCYVSINKLLWNKIPATDIRKQWWVDEGLHSTLIEGLTWKGKGDIANLTLNNEKEPFLPYTNVKFGCLTIGTTTNDEDFPLMRVEEMILVRAEGLAKSGKEAEAAQLLSDFVTTYRDPQYSVNGRGLSLADEIWFQRRVELWGEGFGIYDIKRLGKPLVRFHGTPESTNFAPAFRFNMAADDGWLLMRFPQTELDTNFSIEDNNNGSLPVMDQNPTLRDGVTD